MNCTIIPTWKFNSFEIVFETVVKIGTRVARGGFITYSQLVVKEFDRYATFLNQGWEGLSRINANS